MALPSSGPISLADIQAEFGGSNPISLSEYYAGGAYVPAGTTGTYGAVPSSGAISLRNFYGTSKSIWKVATSGVTTNLNDVTWSGSQYVAVGGNGSNNPNVVLYSTDAVNWSATTAGNDYTLYGITWSGSQYVAVGSFGIIYTSANGTTWTKRTSPFLGPIYSVAWSGSRFVAVGADGQTAYSSDGVNWTSVNISNAGDLNDIAWNGSVFLVCGDAERLYTSPDGVTWTQRYAGVTNGFWYSVTWDSYHSLFVMCGEVRGSGDGVITTSPDGITWTTRNTEAGKIFRGVSGASLTPDVVTVGDAGAIRVSNNAVTWATSLSSVSTDLNGVDISDTKIVIVGDSGTILYYP